MRKSEMLRLRWDDIDFERGFICIREPKGGMNEKIPLNSSARRILETHPRWQDPLYIFPGKHGKERHRNAVARQLRIIKKKAGLPEGFVLIMGYTSQNYDVCIP